MPLPIRDKLAEEAVIASLVIGGEDSLAEVKDILKPSDFFGDRERWCYEVCLILAQRSEEINEITIAHELLLRGQLQDVGLSYFSLLVSRMPTSVFIVSYANCILDMSRRRAKLQEAHRLTQQATHYDATPGLDIKPLGKTKIKGTHL